MVGKISEQTLRAWLRSVWAKGSRKDELGLRWIEPASGSTVGDPDVLVPLGGKLVPVELKLGRIGPGDIVAPVGVRPAQRRYHNQARRSGIATAYLVAVPDEWDSFDVYLVSGTFENEFQPGNLLVSVGEKVNAKIDCGSFLVKLQKALMSFYGD